MARTDLCLEAQAAGVVILDSPWVSEQWNFKNLVVEFSPQRMGMGWFLNSRHIFGSLVSTMVIENWLSLFTRAKGKTKKKKKGRLEWPSLPLVENGKMRPSLSRALPLCFAPGDYFLGGPRSQVTKYWLRTAYQRVTHLEGDRGSRKLERQDGGLKNNREQWNIECHQVTSSGDIDTSDILRLWRSRKITKKKMHRRMETCRLFLLCQLRTLKRK